MSHWTRHLAIGATLLSAAPLAGAGLGPDQAEMGACLRDRRALSHRGAVGRRRDQEAHQRQIRDRGVSGLAARQREPDQRRARPRHRRHDLYRRRLRRARSTSRSRSPTRPSCCATSTTGRPIATASCSATSPRATRTRPSTRSSRSTYYGQRHVTANKEINKPDDMKGMKLRVPPAPLFLMFTKSVGANATPIAFAEVYLALQQKTVDGQENPLPTIMAKKFYEVQTHIMLTGHITESLLTIVGTPCLGEARRRREEDLRGSADRGGVAAPPTRSAPPSRRWPTNSRKLGKTVVDVRTAQRSARRRCRCTTTRPPARLVAGRIRRAAGAEVDHGAGCGAAALCRRGLSVLSRRSA